MSYLSLTFLCEFRVYLSMEICTKKLQMEYLPTFLIHDRHLAKQEDDVNKKMIFKWTPGFRLSQSWQTRAAIGSSESYGALPLRGAGSQQSAWAQGGATPALQAPL